MPFGKTKFYGCNIRHSFENILLGDSINLIYILEILGYAHSKAIKVYTPVSAKSLKEIICPLFILKLME